MGIPIYIIGQSGTGKSASLRNFKSDEILLINVMSKPLPFKGSFAETYNGDNYVEIAKAINKTDKKTVVIDDAQYLMANEFMRRSSETGYQKFTDIANNFWTLINGITNDLPADVIVFILMHTDTDDNGKEKAKTIGKMLDEKICIEGMSSIVLKTAVKDGVYTFTTQNNGRDTVKSPLGMFSTFEIDNDLKAVDQTVRAYWNIGGDASEIMEQHDAEVDAGGVSTEAPKAEKRRSRRADKEEPAEEQPRRERKKRDAAPEQPEKPATPEGDDTQVNTPPRERRRKTRTETPSEVANEVKKVSDAIESAEAVETTTRRSRRGRRAEAKEKYGDLSDFETIDDGDVPF